MPVTQGENTRDDNYELIRTSEDKWFEKLAKVYKDRKPIRLVDDANVGIDPARQTLLGMGKQAGLAKSQWGGVLVALGMTGVGVWMIVAAIIDPEPTSKLSLLIAGGTACVLGGGFTAIRILTKLHPPSVTVSKRGIIIKWD